MAQVCRYDQHAGYVGLRFDVVPFSSKDLFARDERGRTMLFDAAWRGDVDAVHQMIFSLAGTGFAPQRLAFIEIQDSDGCTAADVAEQQGHREIAALLNGEQARMELFE